MSRSHKIDLLLPGIFNRLDEWSKSYQEEPQASELAGLLKLADRIHTGSGDYESTLWQLLDPGHPIDSELPAGRHSCDLQGEVVCRADPVHLTAGISDLMLIEGSQLDLAADECELLVSLVNGHVAEVGGQFQYDGSTAVLAFKEAPALNSTPISKVAGNGIDEFLPARAGDSWWVRLLNEFQMLMFNSEVNRLRESRGKAAVSGLWLWGGGDASKPLPVEYDRCVVRDEPFAKSVLTKSDAKLVPHDSITALFSGNPAGRSLFVDAGLLPYAQYDDFFNWQKALDTVEENTIAPLKQALADGSVSELTIHACNGVAFTYRPSHRWRVWRSRKSLAKYATCP